MFVFWARNSHHLFALLSLAALDISRDLLSFLFLSFSVYVFHLFTCFLHVLAENKLTTYIRTYLLHTKDGLDPVASRLKYACT